MIKDYIRAKSTLQSISLVKSTTLQYCHKELDLNDNKVPDYNESKRYRKLGQSSVTVRSLRRVS